MITLLSLEEYKKAKSMNSPARDEEIGIFLALANATVAKYIGIQLETSPAIDKYTTTLSGNVVFGKGNIQDIVVTKTATGDDVPVLEIRSSYAYLAQSLNSESVEITITYAPYDVDPSVKLAVLTLCDYYLNSEYRVSSSMSGTAVQQPKSEGIPPHIRTILNLNRIL